MARDYLAIPASEVDIKRLFSLGRDILGIRRFSMSMNTLRTLILLRDALNNAEKQKAGRKKKWRVQIELLYIIKRVSFVYIYMAESPNKEIAYLLGGERLL